VCGVADEHDVFAHPGVERDLFDCRDVDVGAGVQLLKQRRGGIREFREQLAEPLWPDLLGCVGARA
jgi:hypothetical protein